MAFSDNCPKLGDTDNNLLFKIAGSVCTGGGTVTSNVNVVSLVAIPSGTNNIGDVDVLSLPSIPAGANNIGSVNIATGGTTQYAEDTVGAAGDLVTLAGVVRQDVVGTLVNASGDRTEMQVDADGRLRVTSADARVGLAFSIPTFATVGVASALVRPATPTRKGLILINTSTNTISLAFGANPAVLNSGITLRPGDSFSMDDYSFTLDIVNAIASLAGSNLAIQEFSL